MSTWTALNLVVDDADAMVSELNDLAEDRDLHLSIYKPDDDSYAQGVDVVVSRFEQGEDVLKEFVSEAEQAIRTMVIVSCSDTTDGATITILDSSDGLRQKSWTGEVSIYGRETPELHPWESIGDYYGEYDYSTNHLDELEEKYGIVPDLGGNYSS